MGVVYRARDLSLDRPVAIKLINDEQAGDADAHRRFEREARMMASIDHPNVIPVYAAGEQDGHLYLVMRYVDGTDLQALLRSQGRLPPQQAARITDQVGRALDAAHKQGLVHRDIKPSNVLLSGNHAYLTDFGITRLADDLTGSTDAGKLIGTFDYMSPEQLSGEPTGPRSDVYSLGCLLYSCLVGSAPFHRDTTAATITAHLHDDPPSVSDVPGVPKQFDDVINRALAKRPKNRYGSAGQLGTAALAAAQGRGDRPWRLTRRGRGAGAAAGLDLRPVPGPSPIPVLAPEPVLGPVPGSVGASDHKQPPASDATSATVVRDDAQTKLSRTAVMPPPPDATRVAPRGAYGSGGSGRSWRHRPFAVAAGLGAAVVVAAVAVGVIELGNNSGPKPVGPLATSEITAAVQRFATDYSRHDVRSLSQLLASDVTRIDPSNAEHGRAAVIKEYKTQFTTKPVPTKYTLSDLTVIPGWAGRAHAQYTLTLTGGGTASGHVVFGLQRDGNRVQVALISTQ
jgi:ketosteroid isomerase-like protein